LFQSSYTWSELIKESQSQVNSDNAATSDWTSNPIHRQTDKSVASFDATQNWRFNTIYRFPSLVSGTTAGCLGVPAGKKLGTPNLWYDPCAFTLQSPGFLGTAGRDILRGPGVANLDFSMVKDTAVPMLGEAGKLEFRTEIFNILNRANFDSPDRTVFAGSSLPGAAPESVLPTAGQITRTLTTSRQIQFALKLIF
jgi:hypothetical protein